MKFPITSMTVAFAWMTMLALSISLHAVPLRVLAWDSEIASKRLAIEDSKGSTIIESMHPSKRTGVYQVMAGDKPPVIEVLDLKDAEGKPISAEIKLPDGVRKPLLLIMPDEKAASGVRLHVLEDDVRAFDWGSTRFINATGRKLVFVHEQKRLDLHASWDPVHMKPGGAARNMEVKCYFFDQPARAFYSGIWEHHPDLRMMVILVPGSDPRLGPVAIKMIPEDRRHLIAAEEAAKAEKEARE